MSKGITTKKKLIEEYKSTISKISSENSLLEKQISDMETTLKLNQNILFDFIEKSSNKNPEITDLINSTKNLWDDNLNLLKKKNKVQIKLSLMQEMSEELPNKIREELRFYKTKNEKNKEEINKQKEKIVKLQKKLINIRRNNFYQDAKTEVYVTSPNKKNVESNQEILSIKSILNKVMKVHDKKEEIAKERKTEFENILKQVDSLKQNFYKKNNGIIDNDSDNNKEMDNIDKYDVNKFVKNNIDGYNISDDEDDVDKDLSEEKDNNEYDADDMLDNSTTKNMKKQLDKLMQEYYKMKEECQKYEKIISNYKEKYRNVEGKIKGIKKPNDI